MTRHRLPFAVRDAYVCVPLAQIDENAYNAKGQLRGDPSTMALIRIDIHRVLRVLEICGTFTSTWPPESTAGKRWILLRELGWTLGVLNVLGSVPPLVLGALHFRDDIIRIMKALSELTALAEVLFNLILCRIGRSRLQVRHCRPK